jgi:hypothetical protein
LFVCLLFVCVLLYSTTAAPPSTGPTAGAKAHTPSLNHHQTTQHKHDQKQILSRRNPLAMGGMGWKQRLLYFDSCAYSVTAPANVLLMLVPLIFMFTSASPFKIPRLWELCLAFGTYFILMQVAMWQAHRGALGGRLEHWRGTQVAFWMAFNRESSFLVLQPKLAGVALDQCLFWGGVARFEGSLFGAVVRHINLENVVPHNHQTHATTNTTLTTNTQKKNKNDDE